MWRVVVLTSVEVLDWIKQAETLEEFVELERTLEDKVARAKGEYRAYLNSKEADAGNNRHLQ